MKNVVAGLKALINPQSSEFWGAIITVLGYIATTTGWVRHDVWAQWAPGIMAYVTLRFVSKVAKS
jgi:hypothetical protein